MELLIFKLIVETFPGFVCKMVVDLQVNPSNPNLANLTFQEIQSSFYENCKFKKHLLSKTKLFIQQYNNN